MSLCLSVWYKNLTSFCDSLLAVLFPVICQVLFNLWSLNSQFCHVESGFSSVQVNVAVDLKAVFLLLSSNHPGMLEMGCADHWVVTTLVERCLILMISMYFEICGYPHPGNLSFFICWIFLMSSWSEECVKSFWPLLFIFWGCLVEKVDLFWG